MSQETRKCEACPREFTPKQWFQKFCSPLCRLRSHRRRIRDLASQQDEASDA